MNRSAKKLKLRIQRLRQLAKHHLAAIVWTSSTRNGALEAQFPSSELNQRSHGGTDYARHPA